jgi:hypothetical protein
LFDYGYAISNDGAALPIGAAFAASRSFVPGNRCLFRKIFKSAIWERRDVSDRMSLLRYSPKELEPPQVQIAVEASPGFGTSWAHGSVPLFPRA